MTIARRLDETVALTNLLTNIGAVQERYEQAQVYLQESLELARQIGHQEQICSILSSLGERALKVENCAEAETYLHEGLALTEYLGHPRLICTFLQGMAELHLRQKDLGAARDAFSAALQAVPAGERKEVARIHLLWPVSTRQALNIRQRPMSRVDRISV